MTDYLPQRTISYKTTVKNTLVSALQDVFINHPDEELTRTNVTTEYPRDRAEYPVIIIRFFERDLSNAGVGHSEMLKETNETTPSSEVTAEVAPPGASVRVHWESVEGASSYRVY